MLEFHDGIVPLDECFDIYDAVCKSLSLLSIFRHQSTGRGGKETKGPFNGVLTTDVLKDILSTVHTEDDKTIVKTLCTAGSLWKLGQGRKMEVYNGTDFGQ